MWWRPGNTEVPTVCWRTQAQMKPSLESCMVDCHQWNEGGRAALWEVTLFQCSPDTRYGAWGLKLVLLGFHVPWAILPFLMLSFLPSCGRNIYLSASTPSLDLRSLWLRYLQRLTPEFSCSLRVWMFEQYWNNSEDQKNERNVSCIVRQTWIFGGQK